jgi:hypothetical protein
VRVVTKAESNVIRRAALVASWLPEVYTAENEAARRDLNDLRVAVEALDRERELAGLPNTTSEGV